MARVELTTRTEVDEFATVYRIEGGEEVSREPGARAVGTTIRVKAVSYTHLGCQQNVNDGERIKGVLMDIGYGAAFLPRASGWPCIRTGR